MQQAVYYGAKHFFLNIQEVCSCWAVQTLDLSRSILEMRTNVVTEQNLWLSQLGLIQRGRCPGTEKSIFLIGRFLLLTS